MITIKVTRQQRQDIIYALKRWIATVEMVGDSKIDIETLIEKINCAGEDEECCCNKNKLNSKDTRDLINEKLWNY